MPNNSAQVRRCVAERGSANAPFCAGMFSRPLHSAVVEEDCGGLDAFDKATHALKFFTDKGKGKDKVSCPIDFSLDGEFVKGSCARTIWPSPRLNVKLFAEGT